MKVFELHFNPGAREDKIFDTFYYEPEDVYEKRLGHLFMAGELSNVLPQNARFLKNLARVLKTKFYSLKTNRPETCLKKSLQEGNSFLQKITKQGDVSWISHLNFAILNLSPKASPGKAKTEAEKYKLNFTRIGNIRIFLARGSKILDIGQKLKLEQMEPYPLKIFFDIISGKIEQGDRVLIMNKEVGDIFLDQNIIEQIAQAALLDEKELNQILSNIKKDIFGICLLILLDAPQLKESRGKLVFKEKPSPRGVVQSTLASIRKKIREKGKKIKAPTFTSAIRLPAIRLPALPKIHLPIPSRKKSKSKSASKKINKIQKRIIAIPLLLKKKNVILILGLVFLILLGGFFAKLDENKRIAQTWAKLEIIQEKINDGDALLILEEKEKANDLFLEVFEEIQSLIETEGVLENEIAQIEQSLEIKLFALNEIEKIKDPEQIFEFMPDEFSPLKIIYANQKIYCFSSYSENIYELTEQAAVRFYEIGAKFSDAVLVDDAILFFSEPNQFFPFQNGHFEQDFYLEPALEDFEFTSLASFRSNLYFLEDKSGQIVKYSYLSDLKWGYSQIWLQNKIPHQVKSMAVDGDIWVLQQDNSIARYRGGVPQETIKIEIFPFAQNFTKIWTLPTLPYLYILEPDEKRIIILDKEGQIVKQYQSEAFDDLKDFAISRDGKIIFFLNGQKIYRIEY